MFSPPCGASAGGAAASDGGAECGAGAAPFGGNAGSRGHGPSGRGEEPAGKATVFRTDEGGMFARVCPAALLWGAVGGGRNAVRGRRKKKKTARRRFVRCRRMLLQDCRFCFGKRAAGCGSVPTRFSHRRVFRRCRQWRASAAARFCPLPRRGRAWRFCQPRLWTGGSPGEFCGSFRWKAHRFCGAIRSSSARGRRSRRRRRAVWRFWRRFSRTAGKVRSSGEKDGRKWKFFLFRETR